MSYQFANNAASTLAAGITNVATSITVATGQGALFPTPSGSDVFQATLVRASDLAIEIVTVTARSGDVMTVTRAQEGTTGLAFLTGDKFELRLTKAVMGSLATLASNTFTSAQILSDQPVSRAMFKDTGFAYYDSTTTNALDYVNGSCQRWAPNTGAQTLTISNWPPTGNLGELLIQGINLGAATITWPTINWVKSDGTTTTTFSSNGVTLQSSGTDWVYLWTRDAGTTIYGKVVR